MYFNDAEGLSREGIEQIQTTRLKKVLARCKRNALYGPHLQGLDEQDISSVAAILQQLPLTNKQDLRDHYPYGMLTCPREAVVRLHASSGTTGPATVIHYTQNDIDQWAMLMARCMHMAGVRSTDIFQNMTGYGLFTGGLGLHYGAERLGCLTIPAGPGNTRRQVKLIQDFGVSVVHIIPSYALYFADAIQALGIDPTSLPLQTALVGAEPHTEQARHKIEQALGVKVYNSYGLSEMNGPGVAFECFCQKGMHVWEDAYIVEILDPKTQQPVADGEVGELVMTTLTREAMPVLRYRTQDMCRILPGQCECGRQHRRLGRIRGRADDMLIIKGVNIYPMQIERVLMAMPEVGQNYLIELENDGFIDQLRVKVELKKECFQEDMRYLKVIQKKITAALYSEILITPRVDLVEHDSLPKTEGKAQRVIDRRDTTP